MTDKVTGTTAQVPRSYLYVPADATDKLPMALGRGADAVIADLEDSVLPVNKAAAREGARSWLSDPLPDSVTAERWIRINAESAEADLAALAVPGLTGVMVPKAEPDLLRLVDARLSVAEQRCGMASGTFRIIALVETAFGVLRAEELAHASRVVRLGIGEADLAGELWLELGPRHEELWHVRSVVVLASACAGLAPPVGPVELDLRNPEALEASSTLLLRQGFRARTALAPRQLEVIHRVFTPSADSAARARRLLELFERSRADGSGVAVDEHGRFVDAATVRTAREVLSRAR